MNYAIEQKKLETQLQTLFEHAWERDITLPEVKAWLNNFTGATATEDDEKLYALFLLTRFVYFGKHMLRQMLQSLYRDHIESPIKQRIRRQCRGTKDIARIQTLYDAELQATRFIGIGNPSESGAHLLYYFRQINYLPKRLFVDLGAAFKPICDCRRNTLSLAPAEPGVARYIFFDDVIGTGNQARHYLSKILARIRMLDPNKDLRMLTLFATSTGLSNLNEKHLFNGRASTLFELDETFRAFAPNTRYFRDTPHWFILKEARRLAHTYGTRLQPDRALGYGDNQLMLGFAHNTPDNTLPIFWDEGGRAPWTPVFPRYDKKYY